MKGFFILLLLVLSAIAYTPANNPTLRKASLLEYKSYMIEVIEKTVHGIEDLQWCNLKIPDIQQDLEYENIFGRNFTGQVTYKNGYVVRIQHLDVTQDSVQQVWTWNYASRTGKVEVKGMMRLHDVVLGFDVESELDGKQQRYTSTFTHRLLNFNFLILKDMPTKNMTVTVTGAQPTSTNKMSYMPTDENSDLLGVKFNPESTSPAVLSWATDIFTPIADDVVMNKVDFPEVCYNC